MHIRYAVLAAALGSVACADLQRDEPVTATDSAGVRVIAHSHLRDLASRNTAMPPLLRIGAVDADGPDLFSGIRSVSIGSDRILVADAGANELRLFDHAGRHLASLGGSGEGPAEFRSLDRGMVSGGDTAIGVDRRGPKLVRFAEGEYLDSWTPARADGTTGSPIILGTLASGGYLAMSVRPAPLSEGVSRPAFDLAVYPGWGDLPSPVGTFPGRERASTMVGPAVTTQLLPWGRDTWAVPAGDRFVTIDPHVPEADSTTRPGHFR